MSAGFKVRDTICWGTNGAVETYVEVLARERGVGRALLDAARDHGKKTGAKRLVLSTAVTNREARALYESYGYKQEDEFLAYKLEL